jgi:hypothetical protein
LLLGGRNALRQFRDRTIVSLQRSRFAAYIPLRLLSYRAYCRRRKSFFILGRVDMLDRKTVCRGLAVAALSVGMSAPFAPAALATEFKLTLSGVFNGTTDASGNPVITETLKHGVGGANVLTTANEAFTLTGIFDTSTGTLLPPPSTGFPSTGYVDYAARSVTLHVGGTNYSVSTSVTDGLTVAIFDQTQIFGPGHYAAGFIQNPLPDWAGVVGDFLTASPDYSVSNLVPTTFGGYFGAGFNTGPCTGGGGSGIGCTTTPIPVDNSQYQLILGGAAGYDLQAPGNGVPIGLDLNPPSFVNSNIFTASLTAVPEPSTWALLLTGFAGVGAARLRSRRTTPVAS